MQGHWLIAYIFQPNVRIFFVDTQLLHWRDCMMMHLIDKWIFCRNIRTFSNVQSLMFSFKMMSCSSWEWKYNARQFFNRKCSFFSVLCIAWIHCIHEQFCFIYWISRSCFQFIHCESNEHKTMWRDWRLKKCKAFNQWYNATKIQAH